METIVGKRVIGSDGLAGIIADQQNSPSTDHVVVELDNGARVMVPRSLLKKQNDNNYLVPISFRDVRSAAHAQITEATVIPVVAEELDITKRTVETGKVRIRKTVREHEETVDEPLLQEEVHVERVPVHQVIEQPLKVRYEGNTMIIPVFEEVLVVEKRLMLKEELHVTKHQTTHHEPQQITVRHEEVNVERLPADREESVERGGNARVE